METITNVATAASRAIFGEGNANANSAPAVASGTEPLSGKQGAGTVESPFDQGNADEQRALADRRDLQTPVDAIPHTNTTTQRIVEHTAPDTLSTTNTTIPIDQHTPGNSTSHEDVLRPKDETKHKDTAIPVVRSLIPPDDPNPPHVPQQAHGHQRSIYDIPTTISTSSDVNTGGIAHPLSSDRPGNNSHVGGFGNIESSTAADPGSSTFVQQQHQGIGQPERGPSHSEVEAVRRTKDSIETAQHQPHNEEIQAHHVVKSTGEAADGGDFDATKPGAGEEADRLMRQKGMHVDRTRHAADDSIHDAEDEGEHGKKHGLRSKIKDKLHLHGAHSTHSH